MLLVLLWAAGACEALLVPSVPSLAASAVAPAAVAPAAVAPSAVVPSVVSSSLPALSARVEVQARPAAELVFPLVGDKELSEEELAARDEARLKALPVLAFGLLPSLYAANVGIPGAFDKDKKKKPRK